MAEQHSGEGAGPSDASVSNSDSTLQLNVKTLDSRIYTFQAEKNMPVLSFKGKIADQVGVPVGQQRLIFRGKVLKDEHSLSEYRILHMENGDTLHLVERQPTQDQTSAGTGADTSGNTGSQGNDPGAGIPRNRIGQISHSVVLGSFNLGDQGEGAGSDLTRVIGAVLNSLGVGSQGMTNGGVGAVNAAPTNHSGPVPQGTNTEPEHGRTGVPSQAQSPFGQPFFSQPFSIPLMSASIPPPSLNLPIPDSLITLSEFMSRMEAVLSQNGYDAPSSTTSSADQPLPELSSYAPGMPTPEALSAVLRHAQRLLSGHAVSALSHIAGRLEQEAGSTDVSVRNQVQSDSVQVGLAMQHLGALFLELGRTILMLRMGQSPAEAVVNSGPAVYISASGPNPIMVQPFPHQTSPLFNAPASAPNSGASIPVGIVGSAPRNINIHIHAGASLPPVVSPIVARGAGGEGIPGERNGSTAAAASGAARVFPVRNVIATAVPSRSATIAVTPVTGASQPIVGVSTSQPPELAAMVSEVNTQIRNILENMRADNQSSARQQENTPPNSSVVSDGVAGAIDPSSSLQPEFSEEGQANPPSDSSKANEGVGQVSASCVSRELSEHSESILKDGETSGDSVKSSGVTEAPLGLGGGLQPKRRGQQSKIQLRRGEGGASSSVDQSQAARASGQQVLQSLLSQSSHGRNPINPPVGTGQTFQARGQGLDNVQSGAQPSDGQVDVTGMMSQLLDSPALNGLLSGVAQQTGVGSPNVLRNMLQQFTQNPAMRNTVNQIAQQVDRDELRNVFTGTGTGQGGNLDFSSMLQQMMPVVSQVLGSVSVENEQVQNLMPGLPPQGNRMLNRDDLSFSQGSQSDMQAVVQQIAAQGSPQDIFRALIQNASEISGTDTNIDEVMESFSSNEELVEQFTATLRSDLARRLQEDSTSGNEP
ncbi:hypothetical protein RND81_01G005500 [Saponaria officinalis]|uniref:Ubiquitin-like domain-containing protein n=1 Tax=Saponaria officinalis TaxID=3572 RepID=A0AAW1NAP4_SAPOF